MFYLSLFLLAYIKLPLKIHLGSLSTTRETKECTSCLILSSSANIGKKRNISINNNSKQKS